MLLLDRPQLLVRLLALLMIPGVRQDGVRCDQRIFLDELPGFRVKQTHIVSFRDVPVYDFADWASAELHGAKYLRRTGRDEPVGRFGQNGRGTGEEHIAVR
ncbi:hypothetical protein BD309DRAFT_89922 [Dichomitus squalens]|uniref:Uncharacterized protein n=1 Tax=Dichomitus squalens TaxID=114155 RepID=A0A4Q9NQ53_9APHY|nr:hypothetical protein BD309DRAFT_89922 [Dichomitus squalens]TBU54851.1 hypothetical protein BD310DRAFT_726215 [Dichomitus squalens]